MSSTCHTNRVGPEHIIARLKALRDPRMRVLALVSALSEDDPTAWVQVLATIMARAHVNDDPDAAEALEVVTHAAADPTMPYGTRQRLYEAAARQQLPAIARLFLVASPPAAGPDQVAKALSPERPLRPTGRPLTLGERKSLARTHDREQILLMLRDPHPAVVAILLDNPHITEADVVRISTARPAVPASLAAVAAHPRWSVRHGVKRALVLNPSTPLADAIRIATTLRAQELRELAADHSLPEPLRVHAAEVYAAALRRPRA
ncbi:MAG TPA: hypothetical protein VFK02_10490 [Kofleriaceae bacterium]|nr:hypothetical protein [Kofleriaceae bacterium]